MKTAIELIQQERQRQINQLGWTPDHDDGHSCGELASAACCYATHDTLFVPIPAPDGVAYVDPWPFCDVPSANPIVGFLPKGSCYLDRLVKAGALIVAEIERLQRLAADEAREAGGGE